MIHTSVVVLHVSFINLVMLLILRSIILSLLPRFLCRAALLVHFVDCRQGHIVFGHAVHKPGATPTLGRGYLR